MNLDGQTPAERKAFILEWVKDSLDIITVALENIRVSERPDFWLELIDCEQKRIKRLTDELVTLKRQHKKELNGKTD